MQAKLEADTKRLEDLKKNKDKSLYFYEDMDQDTVKEIKTRLEQSYKVKNELRDVIGPIMWQILLQTYYQIDDIEKRKENRDFDLHLTRPNLDADLGSLMAPKQIHQPISNFDRQPSLARKKTTVIREVDRIPS